jgi:hypothetical protein
VGLLGRDLLDGNDVATVTLVSCQHLLHAAAAQHVRQQHGERLVTHNLAGTPHRVAEAEGRLLAGEAGLTGLRQILLQLLVGRSLPTLLQGVIEFEGDVEMVLDDRLAAPRDEDEVLDAGFARFIDDMLNDGSVDDREHLLGDRLGRGQEARAQARDGQDGLADRFHRKVTPATERKNVVNGAACQIGYREASQERYGNSKRQTAVNIPSAWACAGVARTAPEGVTWRFL